jgi:hypothetical protein
MTFILFLGCFYANGHASVGALLVDWLKILNELEEGMCK